MHYVLYTALCLRRRICLLPRKTDGQFSLYQFNFNHSQTFILETFKHVFRLEDINFVFTLCEKRKKLLYSSSHEIIENEDIMLYQFYKYFNFPLEFSNYLMRCSCYVNFVIPVFQFFSSKHSATPTWHRTKMDLCWDQMIKHAVREAITDEKWVICGHCPYVP